MNITKTVDAWDESKRLWLKEPQGLPDCPEGVTRKWNKSAKSYQDQLYCSRWEMYINPSGFTCELCRKELLPQQQPEEGVKSEPVDKIDLVKAKVEVQTGTSICADCPKVKTCCGGKLTCTVNGKNVTELESCPVYRW